jgi:signal transduction histidine kinase
VVTYGGGLERYVREEGRFAHYQHVFKDPNSLSANFIHCFFEDRAGILYIGTEYGGINKIDRRKRQFVGYANDPENPRSLRNNNVTAFYEDPKDRGKTLWVGTWGNGLGLFDRARETFTFYHHDPKNPHSLSDDVIRCIAQDRFGMLWIGTNRGVDRFDPRTKVVTRYLSDLVRPEMVRTDAIFAAFEDRKGTLWFGTNGGLKLYDRQHDRIVYYEHDPRDSTTLSDINIWCICEGGDGDLWIGTNAGGLNRLERKTGRFTHYMHEPGNPNSISNNKVLSMCIDRKGAFWIGTAGGGLNRFDPGTGRFHSYTEEDGLASNTIQAIVEDNKGSLWISSTRGITKYTPEIGTFVNYSSQDGLQSNEFHVNSACGSVTGELFFGGINGFNVFWPDSVKQNSFVPPIILTEFQLFNKSVPIGKEIDGRVLLTKSISETSELSMTYRDEVFSIGFAALDFTAPDKNLYAYKLEGFDKDWNYTGNRHFATYMKLPAGTYTFRAKGSNNNGVWNEAGTTLRIIIAPPFWETWWFRVLAVLMVVGIVGGGVWWRTRRIVAQNQELEQHVQERTSQLQEANQELEAFSYSVSHDLRTPLRAIDGYSRILSEDFNDALGEDGRRVCSVVRSETQRMNQLIDDLLGLSRLSRTEMRRTELDLATLVRKAYGELTGVEERKRIELQVGDLPPAAGDASLMQQVVMNLLSNAIKFSSKQAHAVIAVSGRTTEREVEYQIHDNGAGFNAKYADRLFKVFQRLHSSEEYEGTGVGLAIVQRVIRRHGGRVWAESEPGNGATFHFTLPRKAREA